MRHSHSNSATFYIRLEGNFFRDRLENAFEELLNTCQKFSYYKMKVQRRGKLLVYDVKMKHVLVLMKRGYHNSFLYGNGIYNGIKND